MWSEKASSSIEAVVKVQSMVSIAGTTEETGGVDDEKNSVPSFNICRLISIK
jgi:hypothetical protein